MTTAKGRNVIPVAARSHEVQELRIFLGAEPGVMNHVFLGVEVRNSAGDAGKMISSEVAETAERTAGWKDYSVGCAFVHGEYCERIHQPAVQQTTDHSRNRDSTRGVVASLCQP
jgi:hypothetical protein